MENFKFEDYRHPWETGDHWELKREFMERYKDTYPIDRLLCLAQAYSNIELLHCSYPVEVMKEIHELSKPLKACKIFRERGGIASSHPNDAATPASRGKRKAANENAGKKAKFINFCAASDVSEMDQNNMCTDKKASEQEELIVSSGVEAVSHENEHHADPVVKNEVDVQHTSKVNPVEIVLSKMQNLAQELRNQKSVKHNNAAAALHNACNKTKLELKYDMSHDRKVSFIPKPVKANQQDKKKKKKRKTHFRKVSHTFNCKLFIAGILISSAEDAISKKARSKATEKAVEILLDSANLYAELVETIKTACQSGSVSSICTPEISGTSDDLSAEAMDFKQETESLSSVSNLNSDVKQVSDMETNAVHELDIDKTKLQLINEFGCELMLKFSDQIANLQEMEEHAAITTAARMLNIHVDIYFKIDDQSSPNDFFVCTLFVKTVAVGTGEGKSKKDAMRTAASYSITHLLNPKMWLCVMHDGNISSNNALNLNNTNAATGDMHNVSLDSNDINSSTCKDAIGKNTSDHKKYVLLSSDNPKENPYQYLKRLSETSGTCSVTEDDIKSIFAMIKNLEKYVHFPSVTALLNTAQKAKISQHISYIFSANEDTKVTSKQFLCELFFKNILISFGCGRSKVKSKYNAGDAAVEKLKNMKNFILKEYNKNNLASISSSENSDVPAITSPFVINRSLLDSTLQKQFVVVDNSDIVSVCQGSPLQILNHSSTFCQKPIQFTHSESLASTDGSFRHRFDVVFDGNIIGTGMSNLKSEAKKMAGVNALTYLKKVVYTIKVKDVQNKDDLVINRHQLINSDHGSGALTEETNIGCKMLKSMGWTGGGIGKTSGIVEPIWADKTSHRGQGFGFGSTGNSADQRDFRKKILTLLHEFKRSRSFNDLIFAKDFSKEERKEIHSHASRLSLNSTSYGIDKCRQLFVRNKYTALELFDYLVNNGGSTNKYYLVDLSKEG